MADALEARRDEIAGVITPRSRDAEAPGDDGPGRAAASPGSRPRPDLATTFAFEDTSNGLVVREAVGVVAAITPWNYPLSQIAAKVAPALAAGCTVVVKPSEVAPLNAFVLAEIVHEAGLTGRSLQSDQR